MISKAFGGRGPVTGGRATGLRQFFGVSFALLMLALGGGRAAGQVPFVAVRSVAVMPDGRMVIGGDFTNYNGVARLRIARLNRDLSLDASFSAATDGPVHSVFVQGDGKVTIGGNFTSVNGVVRTNVARLNVDGSLDPAFDPHGGPDATVNSVITLDDGTVFIAGDFILVDGYLRSGVAKLNANGGVDLGFRGGIGTDGPVKAMVMQPDGKVVIGGAFTSFDATNRTRVARLNANGSLDTTFGAGVGPDDVVAALALQLDGKILLGGTFGNVAGIPRNRVARLDVTGAVDVVFDPGLGPNDTVTALAVQLNGKVLIGGNFSSVAGLTRGFIARLSAAGLNEVAFSAGTGADAPLAALVVQPDGGIVAAGAFGIFDGQPRSGVALVPGEALPATGVLIGQVTDASRSPVRPVSGAQVTVAGRMVTTDFLGNYTLTNLPANLPMTLAGSAAGYSTYYTSVTVAGGQTNVLNFSITPELGAVEGMRFVLNWGAQPRDLDSHLLTPYSAGFFFGPNHIYFGNRGSTSSVPFANLDVDVTFGFGPETMTILTFTNGTYDYYIHNWSQDAALAGSGATVKAYTADGLVATVRVPNTGLPNAIYWHVFRIDGATRQLSIVNSLSVSDPNQPGLPNFTQQPQSVTPRPGQSAAFVAQAIGNAPITYQWQFEGVNIPGATNNFLNIPNAQTTNAGAYTVTASNPLGSVTSSTAYLSLRAGSVTPVVLTRSRNQTVLEGYSANFSVTASGLPLLRYQWQLNGTNISGATNATFTLFSARPEDAGNYSVAITNRLGGFVDLPISLTVISVPVIVAQPTGTNAPLGTRVELRVDAVGTPPLSYRWRRNGFNVAEATTNALLIPSLQPGDAGQYEVIISNEAGAVLSSNVTVRVAGAPVVGQPLVDQQANLGETAMFSVTAAGEAPFTYQWRLNGSDITGETNAALTVTNVRPAVAGTYSVVVSNSFGAVTNQAQLAIIGFPGIAVQPAPQTPTLGATATFNVVAQGLFPLVYQWFTNGVAMAGATNDTLVITNVQPAQAGAYSVLVSNEVGTITSSNALLTVVGPPLAIESVGGQLVLNLPVQLVQGVPVLPNGFVLEYTDQLGPAPVWIQVTDLSAIPTATTGSVRFFRLMRP